MDRDSNPEPSTCSLTLRSTTFTEKQSKLVKQVNSFLNNFYFSTLKKTYYHECFQHLLCALIHKKTPKQTETL